MDMPGLHGRQRAIAAPASHLVASSLLLGVLLAFEVELPADGELQHLAEDRRQSGDLGRQRCRRHAVSISERLGRVP